jgi:hypothetical protein
MAAKYKESKLGPGPFANFQETTMESMPVLPFEESCPNTLPRTIRYDSSTRLTTLLGMGLGRITVVHPLPNWAVKPGPREMYQPGANTELY